jgi:hypothetical protein
MRRSLLSLACAILALALTRDLQAQAPDGGPAWRQHGERHWQSRGDRSEFRHDRRDFRFDRRDFRRDHRELRRDYVRGAGRRDLRRDRWDLRHDRRDFRHDRRDLRWDRREQRRDPGTARMGRNWA